MTSKQNRLVRPLEGCDGMELHESIKETVGVAVYNFIPKNCGRALAEALESRTTLTTEEVYLVRHALRASIAGDERQIETLMQDQSSLVDPRLKGRKKYKSIQAQSISFQTLTQWTVVHKARKEAILSELCSQDQFAEDIVE